MADIEKRKSFSFGRIVGQVMSVASLVYLVNPGAGILEFIPDNLPFVGNIDEALATAILLGGLKLWRGKSFWDFF